MPTTENEKNKTSEFEGEIKARGNTTGNNLITHGKKDLFQSVAVVAIASVAVMILYIFAKSQLFPGLSYGQSDFITIIFASVLASTASYFALYEIYKSNNRLKKQIKIHKKSELKLKQFSEKLENKIEEKTSALESLNYQLSEEISRREEIEAELKENREKFRSIFQRSPVGIFHYNKELIITDTNDKLVRLLNTKRESLIDLRLRDIKDKSIIPALEATLQGKDGFYEGSYFATTSNAFLFASLRTTPYYDDEGNFLGGIAIVEDITERKKHEEELKASKERAEKSDTMKSEFLAQMSHEIRTPLSSILSFTQLLRTEYNNISDDERENIFDMIKHSNRRIIRTIDMILNMSEINTGSFEYNSTEFDLIKDILEPLHKDFTWVTESKNVEVNLKTKSDSLTVKADEYSINQIFVNLIDNAVKYTPEGYIDITVTQKNNTAVVSVIDSGIGISEEYIPNLFRPFSQEESGYSRKYEGNGLGLALVKKYCEINDAAITVESEKGVGTKFTVTIPLT